MTHNWDRYPKSFLGLSYSKFVTLLLGLVPNLFGFNPCLLSFSLGLFNLIFQPLGFIQLFFERCHLFPGSSQLVSSLASSFGLWLASVRPPRPSQHYGEHALHWSTFSLARHCYFQQWSMFAQLLFVFSSHLPIAGRSYW